MIAIRTHASKSTGIGHLVRCYRLATVLKNHNLESHFIIDEENPFIEDFLKPFNYSYLYQGGESFRGQESDAQLFIAALKDFSIDGVVVDDYRLSMKWDKNVERIGCPLIVLDDRDLVAHQCSMIVDAKWTGATTSKRYEDKVSENCLRLLGPDYVILDELYMQPNETSKHKMSGNTINIMVSLGGGGDMNILRKLIEKLLKLAPSDINFLVQSVVGPFAINKKMILSFAEKDRRVQSIFKERSLHNYLKTTTLYIGTAGGTLYEVLSMNIPALTFALSENQYNQLNHLEDLGHYFHLNDFSKESFDKLAELAWSMALNINRIQNLYAWPAKIKINGLGAERVAKSIDYLVRGGKSSIEANHLSQEQTVHKNEENQNQGYVFTPVNDRHVNHYLDARNLDMNLQNMTETEKVIRLDHYLWWLKTERISYMLKKNNEPLLYIWHLQQFIEGETALIGGWFACSESCNAVDVVYALNRQLELTDNKFPGLPWVAVIKKTNRFVLALNKRFGFNIMDETHPLFKVISPCFPSANLNAFNYLFR